MHGCISVCACICCLTNYNVGLRANSPWLKAAVIDYSARASCIVIYTIYRATQCRLCGTIRSRESELHLDIDYRHYLLYQSIHNIINLYVTSDEKCTFPSWIQNIGFSRIFPACTYRKLWPDAHFSYFFHLACFHNTVFRKLFVLFPKPIYKHRNHLLLQFPSLMRAEYKGHQYGNLLILRYMYSCNE